MRDGRRVPDAPSTPEVMEEDPVICADCDKTITGPAERLLLGDSMSGARPDTWVHPVASVDCEPKGHAKLSLRRALAPPPRKIRRRREVPR